jgi:hypothetical protein
MADLATPVILANGVELHDYGVGTTDPVAEVGDSIALTAQDVTGWEGATWQILSRPAGSGSVLPATGLAADPFTVDAAGVWTFLVTAVGGGRRRTATAYLIVCEVTATYGLRKIPSGLALRDRDVFLHDRVNELADALDGHTPLTGNATSIQGTPVVAGTPTVGDMYLVESDGSGGVRIAHRKPTLDDLGPAASTTLAKTGGTSVLEIGATLATPAFTSNPSSTPSSAIATDSEGNTPQNVTLTPTSWTSPYSYTKSTNGESVTVTVTDVINGVTKTASVTAGVWGTLVRWGTSNLSDAAIAALNLAGQRALIAGLGAGSGGSSQIATGRTRSLTYTFSGAGYRPLVSNPTSHGTPVFKDSNGFVITATKILSAVDDINAQGVHVATDVYILTGPSVGAGSLTIAES